MPDKSYSQQVPEPTRFEALAGPFRTEAHDNWPNHFDVSGQVAGEDRWEWVAEHNDPHIVLREKAIERLPEMLAHLVETYDLLLDASDRGEIDGPDWCGEGGEPDRTGKRLGTLMDGVGETLSEIEDLAVRLGLENFAVVEETAEGARPVSGWRFRDQRAAYRFAGDLSRCAATARPEHSPEYLVVPARLVDESANA